MSMFHVNPETGDAGACHATKGKCPFGGPDEHFTSIEGARHHYEQLQSKSMNITGVSLSGEPLTYSFPERNLELAKASIETANRRLEKAGVAERFTYEVEHYLEYEENKVTGLVTAIPKIRFTVNTPAVKFEGYQFLGAIEKAEAGFVVKTATGVNLAGYDPDAMRCDSCGKAIGRQKTYLVEDEEGKMIQVGSSCVKNYFGVQPQGLWALTLDPLAKAESNDRWSAPLNSFDKQFPTEWTMAYALAVSDGGEKFVSRAAAGGYGDQSTADLVKTAMVGNDRSFSIEMRGKAEKYVASGEAKRLVESLRGTPADTDYGRNLSVISKGEYTRWEHLNLLVSGLSAIGREKRAAAKQAHEDKWGEAAPGYAGQVGDKLNGRKLKVYSTYQGSKPARFGTTDHVPYTKVIFRDENNNELIWWASKHLEMKEGEEVTVGSGHIKKLDHRNGVDQTVITRIRLKEDA